jgi:hypothetical protein
MKRLAHSINIKPEVKIDFVLDQNGNPTEETFEYREFEVLDEDGVILEIGKYFSQTITLEEILISTGIKFGVSTWFIE